MEKLKKVKSSNIVFYGLLFLLFLVWNLILSPICLDEIWNYGFSHNISIGLVPYKDFNMIITPFYPMFMSLFLSVFGSSLLVMHVVNAIMLTICSFLLWKLIGDKAWLVVFFFFFFMQIVFPGYNIFLFILFVLLIYLEKKQGNDYLIGIFLALVLLTKQSVGVCFLLPSLYYLKDLKKIFKRFIGFLGPCILFMVYLLVTKSFGQFIDLCVLGLFDFASTNGSMFNVYWIIFILMVGITIYFIFKDKSNIVNYYGLAFFSVMVPLFDKYHMIIAFYGFLVVLLSNLKFSFKNKINFRLVLICCLMGMGVIVWNGLIDDLTYPNDIKHFEYRRLDNYTILFTKEMNNFVKDNQDKKIVFLNSNGYYFKLVNDLTISYLDLINDGNWGYNGSSKLYNAILELDDVIFVVDEAELNEIYQTNKEIIKYVISKGTKIDTVGSYDVYVIS